MPSMKTFKMFEKHDRESIGLSEMARSTARPDRMLSKFDKAKKNQENSLSKGVFLQAFVDLLNKGKSLPIVTFEWKFKRLKSGKLKRVGSKPQRIVKNVKITNSPTVIKQVEKAAAEMDFVVGGKSDRAAARRTLTSIRLTSKEGVFTLFDVDDSAIKPKTGRKMGGGETPINQALQCVVCACMANKIYPFPRNANQIEKHVRIGSAGVEEIIRGRDSLAVDKNRTWTRSAVSTFQALEKKFGNLSKFIFVEEKDPIAESIQQIALRLFKEFDESINSTMMDRWNPADIWLIQKSFDVKSLGKARDIFELSEMMIDLYDQKKLIAVSMKKAGTAASIKVRNHEKDTEGLTLLEFETKPVANVRTDKPYALHGSHDFVSTADSKKKIRVDTYTGEAGNLHSKSLILALFEGTGSLSDGSIGGATANSVLANFFKMPTTAEIREEYKAGYPKGVNSKFWRNYHKMYTSVPGNPKISISEMRNIAYAMNPPDTDTFAPVKGSGNPPYSTYINTVFLNKYMKLSVAKRGECLQEIYKWCSSMSPASSVHVVVGADTSITKAADNSNRKRTRRKGVDARDNGDVELPTVTNAELKAAEEKYSDDGEVESDKGIKSSSVGNTAVDDMRWKTFERLKRDDIKNLGKRKREFDQDSKRMDFDDLRDKWVGVGKIPKSNTSDMDLSRERDKFV